MTEPTNRPDLPDIDEDDEPKAGKLVMSREVRGWMAGLAAVLVAVAAIAPSIEFGDLTGAVVPGTQVMVGSEPACTDSDQSGGFGGQHVSCTFSCPAGPGSIAVSVDADDSDAQVAGDAKCGGASAHCSGKNQCSAADTFTNAGEGKCDGESDEFYDSGLYVECTVTTATSPDLPTPPPGEICPVTSPVKVCVQPVCHHFDSGSVKGRLSLKDQCLVVWEKLAETIGSNTVSIGYWTDGTSLAGLSCRGYVCTPLELT